MRRCPLKPYAKFMEQNSKLYKDLIKEIDKLKEQLEEASKTIKAVKSGGTDALSTKNNYGSGLYNLKKTDNPYRIFVEKMTEGAIILDKAGIITYSNTHFRKMVGVPSSGITGLLFQSFVSLADESTYLSLIEDAWKEDTKGTLLLVSSARMIPVQLSITTLDMDEGISLSIILTDLTAQKQTELLLKVNNEKLQEINNELESSNHDLQQFASVASHDLQEPLRKIQIFSNLLKEKFSGDLSEEGCSFLDKIISSSKRMNTLIIDILNYSQLSEDENVYSPTDLNAIVNEVLEDFEMRIKEKGAKITIENLPTIEINPGQIRQVFQNIISNALKFVRKDIPPFIRISSKIRKDASFDEGMPVAGGYCYLSFKDNGIGFDDKFANKIFTLFRRLHTKDKFEGTGIGLALSKKIIEKHKGHIIAKGFEGKGSEFIIILPVSQE